VIVGVIDTGINFCHPAFRDPNTGNTRVRFFGFLLDQDIANLFFNAGICTSSDPATCCSELGGSFDSNSKICELDEEAIKQKIRDNDCNWDINGHGTHVAGIAAGSDSSNPYGVGIAPGADLVVFTPITFYDTPIIKGLEWIKQKAQQLGKPAVANMSLGTHYDPHDGTGLLDRKVDELSGQGFIVVVAQSNEGGKPIHAYTTKTSDTVKIRVSNSIIIGWYKNPSQWKIEVCEPGTDNCVGTSSGNDMPSAQQVGNTGCSAKVLASITKDPLNDDGRFQIDITCQSITDLEIRLNQICGDVARVDMWDATETGIFQSNFSQDSIYGGYRFTVASPGTAKRAITVGAINSRPLDTDSFNNLGKIANFSSRGPTRDGRIKPNVVAGGAYVMSADASYDPQNNPNALYKPLRGTSMATPVVTGLVALYLQNNPNATPEDVKLWLTSNAVRDVQETNMNYPNVIYGYGKAVWSDTAGSGGSKEDAKVEVKVGTGAGSCSAPQAGGGGGGCAGGFASLADLITSALALLVSIILRRMMAWFGF
jgi:subtilisin family serine protease